MPNRRKPVSNMKPEAGPNKAITGILSVNARGIGYLKSIIKDKEDIEIQSSNLNTGLNGDTVVVLPLPGRGSERPAGKVISVEKRAKRAFAGILQKENDTYYLLPDDKKMYADIVISKDNVLSLIHI